MLLYKPRLWILNCRTKKQKKRKRISLYLPAKYYNVNQGKESELKEDNRKLIIRKWKAKVLEKLEWKNIVQRGKNISRKLKANGFKLGQPRKRCRDEMEKDHRKLNIGK